jgi:hypothetical protein
MTIEEQIMDLWMRGNEPGQIAYLLGHLGVRGLRANPRDRAGRDRQAALSGQSLDTRPDG